MPKKTQNNSKAAPNAIRDFWNQIIKPNLPIGRLYEFFEEIFGNNDKLPFSWSYFESLYSIFQELVLPIQLLWDFHKTLLNITSKNHVSLSVQKKIYAICLCKQGVKPRHYSKYLETVKRMVWKPKYAVLFSIHEKEEEEEFLKKQKTDQGEKKIILTEPKIEHSSEIANINAKILFLTQELSLMKELFLATFKSSSFSVYNHYV